MRKKKNLVREKLLQYRAEIKQLLKFDKDENPKKAY